MESWLGDTLRPLLARLTVDADGNIAGTTNFDGQRVHQWAYNAANDAQAIYLPYIGSAGVFAKSRLKLVFRIG